MEDLIKWLQDLEKVILVSSNIIMALLALYNAIRAHKWKETTKFVMREMKVWKENYNGKAQSKESGYVFVPENIRKYYIKAENELK